MGITSQDIAAQRAMLERGEQIIEAKKQHAETDRLRDTFAAAALTGLLAGPGDKDFSADYWARHAYEAADAMLRERSRTGKTAADTTPQSRAGMNASEAEIDALEFVVEEGRTASVDDYGILRSWLIRLRPEWESQSHEEGKEKPMNATMDRDTTPGECSVLRNGSAESRETAQQEPVAWAILHKDHQYVSLLREHAEAHNVYVDAEIVPLYRLPTLTAEEREAIDGVAAFLFGLADTSVQAGTGRKRRRAAATLRSLLERLK
jgi:hypothetical protein